MNDSLTPSIIELLRLDCTRIVSFMDRTDEELFVEIKSDTFDLTHFERSSFKKKYVLILDGFREKVKAFEKENKTILKCRGVVFSKFFDQTQYRDMGIFIGRFKQLNPPDGL